MRRLCLCVVMVSTLLIASAPVQASQNAGNRPAAQGSVKHVASAKPGAKRAKLTRVKRSRDGVQKFTWGRT